MTHDQFIDRLVQPEPFILRQNQNNKDARNPGVRSQGLVSPDVQIEMDFGFGYDGSRRAPQLQIQLDSGIMMLRFALGNPADGEINPIIWGGNTCTDARHRGNSMYVRPAQAFLKMVLCQHTSI